MPVKLALCIISYHMASAYNTVSQFGGHLADQCLPVGEMAIIIKIHGNNSVEKMSPLLLVSLVVFLVLSLAIKKTIY